MKRAAGLAGGGLLGAVIACAISSVAAFFFMGVGAGIGEGLFPDFHYNLIADRICPEGTTFDYTTQEVENFDGNSASSNNLHCYDASGTDVSGASTELTATAYIWGGYFALCFIPLFLVLMLFGGALLAVVRRMLKRNQQEEAPA